MKEFDQRQLNIMIQKINGFKSGHVYLSELIYDWNEMYKIKFFKKFSSGFFSPPILNKMVKEGREGEK